MTITWYGGRIGACMAALAGHCLTHVRSCDGVRLEDACMRRLPHSRLPAANDRTRALTSRLLGNVCILPMAPLAAGHFSTCMLVWALCAHALSLVTARGRGVVARTCMRTEVSKDIGGCEGAVGVAHQARAPAIRRRPCGARSFSGNVYARYAVSSACHRLK